jgi:hypothetical protein
MRIASWIPKTINTLQITYYLLLSTMVARTRFNVTSYLHRLPNLVLKWAILVQKRFKIANISKFEPAHNLLQELKTNTASLLALTGAQKNVSSHLMISLVVWWSELLTTNHEVPGSIPGSTIGIFLVGGGSPW